MKLLLMPSVTLNSYSIAFILPMRYTSISEGLKNVILFCVVLRRASKRGIRNGY